MKRYARILFGIAISLLALWLILRAIDLNELRDALLQANYWWLLPSGAFLIISNFARAQRWRVLLENRLSVMRLYWITNIGYLLSNVLPLRLGELGRMYLASRKSDVTFMQALSTGILERLIDVLVVVGIMAVILPLAPNQGLVVQASAIAAAVAFVGLFGLFVAAALRERVLWLARAILGRIQPQLAELVIEQVDRFLLAIRAAQQGNRLWSALFWTVVIWVLSGISCWALLVGFVPGVPIYVGLFTMGAVALGLGLPSSPSGVGVFEAAAVAGLLLFGISESTGFAYAVVLHLLNFVILAVFGVIGLEAEKVTFGEVATAAQNVMKRMNEKPTDPEEKNEAN